MLTAARGAFVEAFGVEEREVVPGASLIDDLGAESLDLLDLFYRLETTFGTRIPQPDYRWLAEERTRAVGIPFEVDGILTLAALEHLRRLVPGVPPERFRVGMLARDITRLFTVQTVLALVAEAQDATAATG